MKIVNTKHYRHGKHTIQFLAGILAGILEILFLITHKGISIFRKILTTRRTKTAAIKNSNHDSPTVVPESVTMAMMAMVKLGFSKHEAKLRVQHVLSQPHPPKDVSELLAESLAVKEYSTF